MCAITDRPTEESNKETGEDVLAEKSASSGKRQRSLDTAKKKVREQIEEVSTGIRKAHRPRSTGRRREWEKCKSQLQYSGKESNRC